MRKTTTNDSTSYFVLDDHTLGYVSDAAPTLFGVLAADIHGHNPINGPIVLDGVHRLRPATKADFDAFRIDATGHLLMNTQRTAVHLTAELSATIIGASEMSNTAGPEFEDRVRFNWGFHDGTHSASGAVPVRNMHKHPDNVYAAGYRAGIASFKTLGYRAETSDAAWSEFQDDQGAALSDQLTAESSGSNPSAKWSVSCSMK
jgi:hypothetical protein